MMRVEYAQGLHVTWTDEEYTRLSEIRENRRVFNEYLDMAESHKTVEWMVRLYKRGLSARQIGWLYGRSLWKVKRILRDSGVKMRAPSIDSTLLTIAERSTIEGRINRAEPREGKL